jgi:glucose/arabinose dehydrogenase
MKWVDGQLFATNMGADHLGDNKPADALLVVRQGAHFGWPYCYQYQAQIYSDKQHNSARKKFSCSRVPSAYAAFGAHSSPLGLEYFESSSDQVLAGNFLVALHGSSKTSLQRGYSIMSVRKDGQVQDFISGFLQNNSVHGRPVDVMKIGADTFLFTDDHAGVIYYVFKKTVQ